MGKKRVRNTDDSRAHVIADLREAAFRIRAMSFLIEHFDDPVGPPLDVRDCWFGVGQILGDLHERVVAVARAMEEVQIEEGREREARIQSSDD